MKHRRAISATVYLDDTAAALVDQINTSGQTNTLFALFVERLADILDIHAGKTFVTQDELIYSQKEMMATFMQAIAANATLMPTLVAGQAVSNLSRTQTSTEVVDFEVDLGSIQATVTTTEPDDPEDEDDLLDFNIT